jgi:hypothetical protein
MRNLIAVVLLIFILVIPSVAQQQPTKPDLTTKEGNFQAANNLFLSIIEKNLSGTSKEEAINILMLRALYLQNEEIIRLLKQK